MRTATAPLHLHRARSLDDALARLADAPDLRPIAGCTDVFVEANFGTLADRRFLDLWPLRDALGRIELRDDRLVIGALATYTDVLLSPLVRERLPILAEAAAAIGGVQIQNRGTIGGNVANASPAGDTPPVFLAVDAEVVLRSAGGERRVAYGAFHTGYRATARRPDELIVAIEAPPVDGRPFFRKVGTRAAQAISKVVVAGVRGARPAVAVGSIAPTVVRLPETERTLSRGAGRDEVREAVGREIAPIDDVRSTARYRRTVTANLVDDAFFGDR